jgi:hypothetical protein
MSDRELEIKLLLSDQEALSRLNSALKQVESTTKRSADSMNLTWAGFAAKLFVAQQALRPVIGFMTDAVQAAVQQEDATNRLNVALQNQGTFTEELSRRYHDMATSLQRSTRFGDEAILEVQQRLVAIGNVGPAEMEKVTKATLDLATALKIDLSTASLLMGKAAQGNTEALSRYGLKLDENIPKSQKFAELMRLVQDRFGGSAERDIESYGGATAQLTGVWGDFLEELGNFIIKNPTVIDGIHKTTQAVIALTEALKKHKDAAQQDLTAALVGGAPGLGANVGAQLATSGNVQPVDAAGLAGAGAEIAAQLSTLKDQFFSSMTELGALIAPAGQSILQKFFLGEDPNQTVTAVAETATISAEMLREIDRQYLEEKAALGEQFREQEFQAVLMREQQKIDQQRQLWLAYQDENTAEQLKRNQQEQEMYAFFNESRRKADESYWVAVGKMRDTFTAGMSNMFMGMIRGTTTAKEAFAELGFSMLKILLDYGAQLAVNMAIAKVAEIAHLAFSGGIASATAAAWAPAAAMVSLATFGGNAGPAAAGISSTVGLAQGLAQAGKAIPKAEKGANILSGGSVLVGERGPEILNLPRGARVSPLSPGSQAGGDVHINIEIHNPWMADEGRARELARAMAEEISGFIENERARL